MDVFCLKWNYLNSADVEFNIKRQHILEGDLIGHCIVVFKCSCNTCGQFGPDYSDTTFSVWQNFQQMFFLIDKKKNNFSVLLLKYRIQIVLSLLVDADQAVFHHFLNSQTRKTKFASKMPSMGFLRFSPLFPILKEKRETAQFLIFHPPHFRHIAQHKALPPNVLTFRSHNPCVCGVAAVSEWGEGRVRQSFVEQRLLGALILAHTLSAFVPSKLCVFSLLFLLCVAD